MFGRGIAKGGQERVEREGHFDAKRGVKTGDEKGRGVLAKAGRPGGALRALTASPSEVFHKVLAGRRRTWVECDPTPDEKMGWTLSWRGKGMLRTVGGTIGGEAQILKWERAVGRQL